MCPTGRHLGLLMRAKLGRVQNTRGRGDGVFCTLPSVTRIKRPTILEKMARFRCSASTSLNWGEGCFYFTFYSVQD